MWNLHIVGTKLVDESEAIAAAIVKAIEDGGHELVSAVLTNDLGQKDLTVTPPPSETPAPVEPTPEPAPVEPAPVPPADAVPTDTPPVLPVPAPADSPPVVPDTPPAATPV